MGQRRQKVPTPTLIDWRIILRTTAYCRIPKVECTWEEYGYDGWIDNAVVLLEQVHDRLGAVDLIEMFLKEIEEPLIDRRDYERMWDREMCWPVVSEDEYWESRARRLSNTT